MDLIFPTKFIFITTGYSSNHPAIDNGWCDEYGGPNSPLYAPGDGVVSFIQDGYGTDLSKGYGNYIQIDHGGGISTILAHCNKGGFTVKQGQRVSRGEMVAHMGMSGNAAGYHTHICVLINGNRVDPLLYLHFDKKWQVLYSKTDAEYRILRLNVNPAEKYLVAENKSKNQLHVTADDLRARKAPSLSGEVYGWMPKGFYNAVTLTEADGYRWVKIADDLYAAVVAGCSEYAPAEDKRDEKIKELTAALVNIEDLAAAAIK